MLIIDIITVLAKLQVCLLQVGIQKFEALIKKTNMGPVC